MYIMLIAGFGNLKLKFENGGNAFFILRKKNELSKTMYKEAMV